MKSTENIIYCNQFYYQYKSLIIVQEKLSQFCKTLEMRSILFLAKCKNDSWLRGERESVGERKMIKK